MNIEHPTRIVQLTAALIAIPMGLLGAYTFYHNQISAEGVCDRLRGNLLGIIDRNVPADVKYASMHREFESFEKKCAHIDPDIHTVFVATMSELRVQRHAEPPKPAHPQIHQVVARSPAPDVGPTQGGHVQVFAIFGLSTTGERRGWVALSRLESDHRGELNFDGLEDALVPPAVGARLSARRTLPVWLAPQIPGPNDSGMLQGRLGEGVCVEVLATRPGLRRHWAEVTPASCP